MIVITTNTVQGRSISEYLGIVFGEEVAGEGFSGWLGNFEGSFINLRNQAHSGASTNTYLMVTATGTAVKI